MSLVTKQKERGTYGLGLLGSGSLTLRNSSSFLLGSLGRGSGGSLGSGLRCGGNGLEDIVNETR
jgi:hypothetical protein